MGVTNVSLDMSVGSIVEAMLPRFSDNKLGLHVPIQMDFSDYGYGLDGSTRERPSKSVRLYLHLLFIRPSNYTQVYFYYPDKNAKGLALNPIYSGNNPVVWTLECDHDSCWRTDGFSKITDAYFTAWSKFDKRFYKTDPKRKVQLSEFNFIETISYVQVECQQVNPTAERYSKEARPHTILMKKLEHYQLESIATPDPTWMANSGILIKGSEAHNRYLEGVKRYQDKKSASL